MSRRFSALACCLLTFCCLATAGAEEYVNKEYGFSLTIPEGWKQAESETPGVIAEFTDPVDESYINIQTDVMPLGFASKTYAKTLRQGLEDVLGAKITTAPKQLKVGGQPAWQLTYEHFGMRQMTCQVVRGDVCLAICAVYAEKEKSEKRLQKDVDAVLKSFKFTKKK